ncbi:riboflavin biosynthesis protein RibD [Chitinophaga cymbidii]|uniref:Riboflavin biosynthesis protein RibD n=2 Tax=Chitinophaga cymbidii TaxID=1096750 RepID=A0A512RLL4_9BACT|nr:riboflavin biosynthesis protein RibD [Chitinophaga cymbidii]
MDSISHEIFMQRCLQLAATGMGQVAPNPMVGAVLVHDGRIIGEGYHQVFGQAHAEVNCVNSVPADQQELIAKSTMYVSLEPCSHHGKTPPCADLIISRRIPRVVVGCVDSFSEVAGRGIRLMREAGIEVITGVLEAACRDLNKRFFTFHEQQRPYIILKWAQSRDGYIAGAEGQPVRISNVYTDRLVHQWRSREMGIMVGTRTALRDDPALTTRLWPGKSPVRLVIDRHLQVPETHRLRDGSAPTIFITEKVTDAVKTIRPDFNGEIIPQILPQLHAENIQSVIVEGGAHLLQQFFNSGYWDEARVITGSRVIGGGVAAPLMTNAVLRDEMELHGDRIACYVPSSSSI